MKAIGFSFNDFDFVIDTFQHTCVNREVAMVENTIFISPNTSNKCINRLMMNGFGQCTPFIDRPLHPFMNDNRTSFTYITDWIISLVRSCLDQRGCSHDPLTNNMYSTKWKVMCYTYSGHQRPPFLFNLLDNNH